MAACDPPFHFWGHWSWKTKVRPRGEKQRCFRLSLGVRTNLAEGSGRVKRGLKANKTLLGLERSKGLSSICRPSADGALDLKVRWCPSKAALLRGDHDVYPQGQPEWGGKCWSVSSTRSHQHSDGPCCRRNGPSHDTPIPHPPGSLPTCFPELSDTEDGVFPQEVFPPPPVNRCINILAYIYTPPSCDVGKCPLIPKCWAEQLWVDWGHLVFTLAMVPEPFVAFETPWQQLAGAAAEHPELFFPTLGRCDTKSPHLW